ncbi:MAG: DinB family protein [Planctomycetota bacterium]
MSLRQHILASLQNPTQVIDQYLADISDEELFVRPTPNANHLAWQLGHLISIHDRILGLVRPGTMPALPEGFAERHGKEASCSDNPNDFYTKAEYLEVLNQQRSATQKLLGEMTDEELATEAPEPIRPWVGTVGVAIQFVSCTHWLWHAGQWAVLRYSLGKSIVV